MIASPERTPLAHSLLLYPHPLPEGAEAPSSPETHDADSPPGCCGLPSPGAGETRAGRAATARAAGAQAPAPSAVCSPVRSPLPGLLYSHRALPGGHTCVRASTPSGRLGPGSPLPWGAPRAASGPHLRAGFPLRLSHVSAPRWRSERAASFLLPRLPSPVRGARAALSPGVAIDWAQKRRGCPSELRAPCLPFLSQSATPVPFLENPGAQGPDLRLPPAPHTSPPPPRIPAWVCRAALRGMHFSPADLTVRVCLEN